MKAKAADIIVIGAGIVGASCARALSLAGLKVLVLEQDYPGGGATAAGMGHVTVMDDSDAMFVLTRYSRDLWDAIVPRLSPECEYERRGTLWVAADEEEMNVVRSKHAYYQQRGVDSFCLDSKQLGEAEPNLRAGLSGAFVVPGDAVVYSPVVAQWLLDDARVEVRNQARVVDVSASGVTLADGARVAAGATVCATGTAAVNLFPEVPVRPRKGHLAITDRYPGYVRYQIIELGYHKSAQGESNESVAFNVQPRHTGQLLIGSSRQYGATHSSIDSAILRRMLARALEFMPGLASLSIIRTWTGFRAATADKLPLIGPHPGRDNVYLATGHEGLGITMSLGTGELIADLVLGRQSAIPVEPYLPVRMMQFAHA